MFLNLSSVKSKCFVFIAPHFIPVSFSITSAVLCLALDHGVSEIDYLKKTWGVLHYISVFDHCICSLLFYIWCNDSTLLVTAAAHRPVPRLTLISVKSSVKQLNIGISSFSSVCVFFKAWT